MKIVSVLDDCSMLFRSSSVLPSFYLRYSFDSRAKNKRRNNDGTVVDILIHSVIRQLRVRLNEVSLYTYFLCIHAFQTP